MTKWQKAELSYFTTSHSPLLPPNLFFPITFPAVTKRGPLLYRYPFLIEEPQCWSSSATWNWTCVLSRAWIQIPQPLPHSILFGHIFFVQTSLWTKRGSSVWMYCYCFHSIGGLGVEREGQGKWRISYWSSAGRVGVLYNVELVNCVLWDDGNELLFLFYDLSVSVNWITAIYSERRFLCIIVTYQAEAIRRFTVCTQDWLCPFLFNNCVIIKTDDNT